MSTKSIDEILSEIGGITDNKVRANTAARVRQVLKDIVQNEYVPVQNLQTLGGVADGTTYLAGDGTWKPYNPGGSVTFSGTGDPGLTYAVASTTTFSTPPNAIWTMGRNFIGDYGGALYKKISSLPAAPFNTIGILTTGDGTHYQMVPTSSEAWVSAFGAIPGTVFNDFSHDAWQAFEDCKYWILNQAYGGGLNLRIPPGMFYLSKAHSIEGGSYNIIGCGRNSNGLTLNSGTVLRHALFTDCIQVQGFSNSSYTTFAHEGQPINTTFPMLVGQLMYWPGSTHVYKCTSSGIVSGTVPATTGTGITSGGAVVDYVRELTWSEQRLFVGGGAVIKNIMIWGQWDNSLATSYDDEDLTLVDGGYHSGIVMRSRAVVEHVAVQGEQGHGIAVVGNGDATIRGPANVNDWSITGAELYYNCHDGLHLGVKDTNAGIVIDLDTAFNGHWGAYDASFLTNTFIGIQSAFDGAQYSGAKARYYGMVVHNGYTWIAKVDDAGSGNPAPNYHDEPGNDGGHSWIRWSGSGTDVASPPFTVAWDNTTRYQSSGCWATENINNRASFFNCYIEGGTNPAQWARPVRCYGGIMGGWYDLSRGAKVYEDGVERNGIIFSASTINAAGLQNLSVQVGPFSSNGGVTDAFDTRILETVNNQRTWRLKGIAPPNASVTGAVSDQTLGGNLMGVLTVSAVSSGTFGPGSVVSGGGLPAHTSIARQINPSTGAAITWTGGAGSYALDRTGATVGSTSLTIANTGTYNLDWGINDSGDGHEIFGWTSSDTVRKLGRTSTTVPGVVFARALSLGNGNAGYGMDAGGPPIVEIPLGGSTPSPGDYGHAEIIVNSSASSSGDGVVWYFCKTGTYANTWKKVAALP